jgi:hypothetical protein
MMGTNWLRFLQSFRSFMSDRTIHVAGVEYVRSRDAARLVHLAPDYVSRLARESLIDGCQVAGLWFVNVATLKAFVIEQERQKEIWRMELARQRREEQRQAGHPSALKALFT